MPTGCKNMHLQRESHWIILVQMTVKSFERHINAASCTHTWVTLALIDPLVFTLPLSSSFRALSLPRRVFIYPAVYLKINTRHPAHNTACNGRKKQGRSDLVLRCRQRRAFFQTNMPQHTYTCAESSASPVLFSFCPCLRAGCLSVAHNERPMSSVLVIITLICTKLSRYFISSFHR